MGCRRKTTFLVDWTEDDIRLKGREDDMSKAELENGAPNTQPFDLARSNIHLAEINDELTIAIVFRLNWFPLLALGIGHKDLVGLPIIQVISPCCNMDVDSEAFSIVAEPVDHEGVFVHNVHLAAHVMVG